MEQCRVLNTIPCPGNRFDCYTECFIQTSAEDCNGPHVLRPRRTNNNADRSFGCSWCDSPHCPPGQRRILYDHNGCGGVCQLEDPCMNWAGLNTSSAGVMPRSQVPTSTLATCVALATECLSQQTYNEFARLCIFTPPCPRNMRAVNDDASGELVCQSTLECKDTTCAPHDTCEEKYGYLSCLNEVFDTQDGACRTHNLCVAFWDGFDGVPARMVQNFDTENTYLMGDCLLDDNHNWLLGFQMPLFRYQSSFPGLYFSPLPSPGLMHSECYIDLQHLLIDNDWLVVNHTISSAVRVNNLEVHSIPLSWHEQAEQWDSGVTKGWLRGVVNVSITHIANACEWSSTDVIPGAITAHYLEGGVPVGVVRTCNFAMVQDINTSVGLDIVSTSNSHAETSDSIYQFDPDVEVVGVPNMFYVDSKVGMEVVLRLVYRNVPTHMTVGPFDASGAYVPYIVIRPPSMECYRPRIVRVSPDWAYPHQHTPPRYCEGTICRVLIYLRTEVVGISFGKTVDFSQCITTDGDHSRCRGAQITLDVHAQKCLGRDDLYSCSDAYRASEWEGVGKSITLRLSGLAEPQRIQYTFGGITAPCRYLTRDELFYKSCTQPVVGGRPWMHFETGLRDYDTCLNITHPTPGVGCAVTSEGGHACVYAYVQDRVLFDGLGGRTLIDHDSIVIVPRSTCDKPLPSFGPSPTSRRNLEHTVLRGTVLAAYLKSISMFSRGMSEMAPEDALVWDIPANFTGVDGMCWDIGRLVQFYVDLQGHSFEPFQSFDVSFSVEYQQHQSAATRRNLADKRQGVERNTQDITIAVNIRDIYTITQLLSSQKNVAQTSNTPLVGVLVYSNSIRIFRLQLIFLLLGYLSLSCACMFDM